jgi:aminomethyltransferase
MTTDALRRTPLYDAHVAAGGRFVPFAGWELPVQYAGITEEHIAVRTHAGLFDVTHMGELFIEGPHALAAVQRLITNDAARLAVGAGLYTPMCLPSGGIVDDLTVFRMREQSYLLIVNAATRAKDLAWIQEHAGRAVVRDDSDEIGLLALQGPRASAILAEAGRDLSALPAFHVTTDVMIAGVPTVVSRTGYTGEDGFEIACPMDASPSVWSALAETGRPHGLVPAGLGARDTLRLEAGYMLYGSDIDETTTPLEASLGWTVKFDKGDFIGRERLLKQKSEGVARRLVGFETTDRSIPRHHYAILAAGRRVGAVTSGTFAPALRRPIGMGYVPPDLASPGTALEIEIRGRTAPARVVRLPFYRRPKT